MGVREPPVGSRVLSPIDFLSLPLDPPPTPSAPTEKNPREQDTQAGNDVKAMNTPTRPAGVESHVKFADPFGIMRPLPERKRLILLGGNERTDKSMLALVTAWYMASVGYKTLLLTTDSAAHIGVILGSEVDEEILPVVKVPRLWATRIDQKEAARSYREKILSQARLQLRPDALEVLEETATFDRCADLFCDPDFDVVVFDNAPTEHALRQLELDCSTQGTLAGAGEGSPAGQGRRLEHLIRLLRDPGTTLCAIILRPEETAMAEAHRASLDLQATGIRLGLVIVNQLLKNAPHADASYQGRRRMQRQYLAEIARRFPCPLAAMPFLSEEMTGLAPLEEASEYFFARGVGELSDVY